jgi:hypothetical protein
LIQVATIIKGNKPIENTVSNTTNHQMSGVDTTPETTRVTNIPQQWSLCSMEVLLNKYKNNVTVQTGILV